MKNRQWKLFRMSKCSVVKPLVHALFYHTLERKRHTYYSSLTVSFISQIFIHKYAFATKTWKYKVSLYKTLSRMCNCLKAKDWAYQMPWYDSIKWQKWLTQSSVSPKSCSCQFALLDFSVVLTIIITKQKQVSQVFYQWNHLSY